MGMKLGSNVDLNRVVKSLGKKYKLVPHLDMCIGKGDFEWEFTYAPKQGDDAWHPSGDCTPSLYELYMKASDPQPRQIPASLYKTFMVGHFFHQYIQFMVVERLGFATQEAIERRGVRRWGDQPYQWATGSADIAPCSIPGHGDYLIDIKTMNGRDFARQEPPAWAVDKWECQLNVYMDWFDLDRAILLGIQKDSPHDFKEFFFERNQPLIDSLYAKWQVVSACLAEGVVPPQDEPWPLPLKGSA